tara:strand:+ start:565 stop:771 length:207 start_codon:yes stop_codon:yes gene_type:complete
LSDFGFGFGFDFGFDFGFNSNLQFQVIWLFNHPNSLPLTYLALQQFHATSVSSPAILFLTETFGEIFR